MTQNDGYSRRRLIQAMAAAGGLGALGGAATGAYLSDRASFPGNLIGTGAFVLELAVDRADDSEQLGSFSDDDFQTDGSVAVGVDGIEPGDAGVLRVGHRLGDGPGRIWMRAISSTDTDLGSSIDVELLRRPTCDVEEGILLYEGTLDDLTDAYADGALITDGCVDGEGCLDLRWAFQEDTPDELSEESLSCSLDFTAVQCRHNQTEDNPWNETD